MMRLTLPYPPSTNELWATVRGRRVCTAKYKAFKDHAGGVMLVAGVRRRAGALAVYVRVFRPTQTGDVDGRVKALLDAMNGVAYTDDKQIAELHVYNDYDKTNPRVELILCDAGTKGVEI